MKKILVWNSFLSPPLAFISIKSEFSSIIWTIFIYKIEQNKILEQRFISISYLITLFKFLQWPQIKRNIMTDWLINRNMHANPGP